MNDNKINIQTDMQFQKQVVNLKKIVFSYISSNRITPEKFNEIKKIMIALGEYIQSFEDQSKKEKKALERNFKSKNISYQNYIKMNATRISNTIETMTEEEMPTIVLAFVNKYAHRIESFLRKREEFNREEKLKDIEKQKQEIIIELQKINTLIILIDKTNKISEKYSDKKIENKIKEKDILIKNLNIPENYTQEEMKKILQRRRDFYEGIIADLNRRINELRKPYYNNLMLNSQRELFLIKNRLIENFVEDWCKNQKKIYKYKVRGEPDGKKKNYKGILKINYGNLAYPVSVHIHDIIVDRIINEYKEKLDKRTDYVNVNAIYKRNNEEIEKIKEDIRNGLLSNNKHIRTLIRETTEINTPIEEEDIFRIQSYQEERNILNIMQEKIDKVEYDNNLSQEQKNLIQKHIENMTIIAIKQGVGNEEYEKIIEEYLDEKIYSKRIIILFNKNETLERGV